MVDDAATIKDGTNENNTDIDRWADARRLRINGKACSKPWRSPNLRDPLQVPGTVLPWTRYALALDDETMAAPQPAAPAS